MYPTHRAKPAANLFFAGASAPRSRPAGATRLKTPTRRGTWKSFERAAGTLPETNLPLPRCYRSCEGRANKHGVCGRQTARQTRARPHSALGRLTEHRKRPWALRFFVDSNDLKIGRTSTLWVRCEAWNMSCIISCVSLLSAGLPAGGMTYAGPGLMPGVSAGGNANYRLSHSNISRCIRCAQSDNVLSGLKIMDPDGESLKPGIHHPIIG